MFFNKWMKKKDAQRWVTHTQAAQHCHCPVSLCNTSIVALSALLRCTSAVIVEGRDPFSFKHTAKKWFMAYWNRWSPSLLRNGEWLGGEEKKIHMRVDPSSALSLWVDKRGATIPLKSFHYGNSGPDISKFDSLHSENTEMWCGSLTAKKGWALFLIKWIQGHNIYIYTILLDKSDPEYCILGLFIKVHWNILSCANIDFNLPAHPGWISLSLYICV